MVFENKKIIDATVIILTFNEELHIKRLLESIVGIFESIVIVDSGSTDDTLKIAHEYGVTVKHNKWPGDHASQLNWAIDNINITTKWVFRIDADEVLSDDVIVELIHPSFCGSGGCYQYIIMNNKGKWEAIGQSRSTYYLSKKDDNGKSTFYYADYCMLSPCIYYRLDLDNLN